MTWFQAFAFHKRVNLYRYVENRVLRRIIKTFTNDPKGDFAKWARNPLVIQMLTRAKDVSFPTHIKVHVVFSFQLK
jgi:hypothetical protein